MGGDVMPCDSCGSSDCGHLRWQLGYFQSGGGGHIALFRGRQPDWILVDDPVAAVPDQSSPGTCGQYFLDVICHIEAAIGSGDSEMEHP